MKDKFYKYDKATTKQKREMIKVRKSLNHNSDSKSWSQLSPTTKDDKGSIYATTSNERYQGAVYMYVIDKDGKSKQLDKRETLKMFNIENKRDKPTFSKQ